MSGKVNRTPMIALTAKVLFASLPTVASPSQLRAILRPTLFHWLNWNEVSSIDRTLSFTEAGIDAVQVEYVDVTSLN